jgi:hypothetical protein
LLRTGYSLPQPLYSAIRLPLIRGLRIPICLLVVRRGRVPLLLTGMLVLILPLPVEDRLTVAALRLAVGYWRSATGAGIHLLH